MIYSADNLNTIKDGDVLFGSGYGFTLIILKPYFGKDGELWLRDNTDKDNCHLYQPDGFEVISDDRSEVLLYNVKKAFVNSNEAVTKVSEQKEERKQQRVLTAVDIDCMIDERVPKYSKPKQDFIQKNPKNKKAGNRNDKRSSKATR